MSLRQVKILYKPKSISADIKTEKIQFFTLGFKSD